MSDNDASNTSGILSGVFDFIARELESFVSTATGHTASQEYESSSSADYSARRARRRRRHGKKRHRTPTPSSSDSEPDYSEPHSRRSSVEQKSKKPTGHRRKRVRELEQYDGKAEQSKTRIVRTPSPAYRHYDTEPEPEPKPPAVPKPVLKRRLSVTMPGSLYPRSPSVDPEAPVTNREYSNKVRFAPPVISSSTQHADKYPPEAGPSRPLSPRQHAAGGTTPTKPQSCSSVKAAAQKFRIGDDDAGPSILLPKTNITPTKSPGKVPSYISPSKSAESSPTSKRKGKERATESLFDDWENDSTGEQLVRGKEKELEQAIQIQQENETRRERQRIEENDAQAREEVDRERQQDKARIRQLEEEINKLKQELEFLRRPTFNQSNFTFALPPPPPPPPPLPNQAVRRLPSVLDDPSILFTAARASLNHAPTPKEKPINPMHISRRQGQPTIGITPDKMAAFLQEMKSVKLRKVAGASKASLDMPHPSYSSSSSRNMTGEGSSLPKDPKRTDDPSQPRADTTFLSRSLIAPRLNGMHPPSGPVLPRTGEKRKRQELGESEARFSRDGNIKRQLLATARSTSDLRSSSFTNHLVSEPTLPSTEPASSQNSQPPPSWLSTTDPDAPTPSLSSDNDPEREDEHDQPPPTPPLIPPSRRIYRFRGEGIPVTPHERSKSSFSERLPARNNSTQDAGTFVEYEDSFVPIQPISPNDTSPNAQSDPPIFKNRIPASPLPSESPQRPLPPNRRRSTPHPKRVRLPVEDPEEGTPLLLSFSSPDAISTPGPSTAAAKLQSDLTDILNTQLDTVDTLASQSTPAQLPQETTSVNAPNGRPESPDVFKEPPLPPPRPRSISIGSRIPLPSSRIKKSTTAVNNPRKQPAIPQNTLTDGRPLTLDEEIRNVDQDELESGVLSGMGTRSKKHGFLANGGGAGAPIFMGLGNVKNCESERVEAEGDDIPERTQGEEDFI